MNFRVTILKFSDKSAGRSEEETNGINGKLGHKLRVSFEAENGNMSRTLKSKNGHVDICPYI